MAPTSPTAPSNNDEDTRTRLIQAAIKLFGQCGFDGVSTRTITEAAGANISAIKYHFGDKAGLYRAVLEMTSSEVRERIKPMLDAFLMGMESAQGDRQVMIRLAQKFASGFAHNLLNNPNMHLNVALFTREYTVPTEFFPILYEGLPKIFHESFSSLIAIIENKDGDDPRIVIRAHILIGQFIVFLVGRLILLQRMNWTEIPPDAQDIIGEEIGKAMVRVLFAPPLEEMSIETPHQERLSS